MTYIGIDPGKSGGLAFIDKETGDAVAIPFDKSDYAETLERLSCGGAVCCLEHVHAMPKQGVCSMFAFGENFGWIQGVLTAHRIPYQLVSPHVWKREFSIAGKDKTKADSVRVAQMLFPRTSLLRTAACHVPHDGMAEALLMAEYARRHF